MRYFAFVLIFVSWAAPGQVIQITDSVKFLALGDSYTIGQSVPATDRWPVQLIDSLRKRGMKCKEATIVAMTGWTTDNLKAGIANAKLTNNFNLVGLLIGVNNQFQGEHVNEYTPQFAELLDIAIGFAKGDVSHVFVVSIPDYGYTPFGKNNQRAISWGIDLFNTSNRNTTAQRNVPYVYITDISRQGLAEPDLVASDGLHPSGKQYSRWIYQLLSQANLTRDTTNVVTAVREPLTRMDPYPNPFDNYLRLPEINIPDDQVTLRLLNTLGVVVLEEMQHHAKNGSSIATLAVPTGLYIYQIVGNGGRVLKSGKLIK